MARTNTSKKASKGPTESEINATAEVIAARLRKLVPEPITVNVAKSHLWLRHPSVEHMAFSFLDVDEGGVSAMDADTGRFKRVSKSIRNIVAILEAAKPLLVSMIERVKAEHACWVASRIADEVYEKLLVSRGISLDDDHRDIPVSLSDSRSDRGVTRIIIEVKHTRFPEIADGVVSQLCSLMDLVDPLPSEESPATVEVRS